jgi:serine/threonine protein kinase/WD40 repeat protein/tetratricopeptide (TPR) repeat protein
MTPESYKRLWSLFDEAQKRGTLDREAFLDEQCAGEPELRGEVEKLIAQADNGTLDLLAKPSPMAVKAQFAVPSVDLTAAHDINSSTLGLNSSPAETAAPVAPDGYEIETELGRGAMGVVYRAQQIALKRTVALKMILAGAHASPMTQARFMVEAEAVAAVRHPNVVEVYEFGRTEGLPYFALEFVDGGTLADQLAKTGRFSSSAAAVMVSKLAAGMAAAHAKGIVHRDLKPANILLTAAGEPKVTDFGLAKVGGSDMTATGAIMGTPNYMSPEQAGGHTREVGTHSDVWALGAILYELLTGRPPFRGDSMQDTFQQVLTRDPERLRATAADVSRDLETICLKCLEKDPKKRYPTADALVADLKAYLEGRPIAARPVGTLGTVVRWGKRNPVIAGALAVAVVALVVGSVISTGFGLWAVDQAALAREAADRADKEADSARTEKAAADTARDVADQEKRNAQNSEKAAEAAREKTLDTLYATSINLAHREWLHGLSYTAQDFLTQAPHARRGWEYDYLRGLFKPERNKLKSSVWPSYVSGSADGTLIATSGALLATADPALHLWDTVTGLDLGTVPDTDRPQLLRFAPKGHQLACAVQSQVRLIDAVTRVTILKSNRFATPIISLSWSVDGRKLFLITLDGKYWRLDASTGKSEPEAAFQLPIHPETTQLVAMGFPPAISPDGRYFAQRHEETDIVVKVWDLTDGHMVFANKDHHQFTAQLSFSPNSRLLASAGGEGTVVVRDVPSGRLVHRLRGHKGRVWAAAFSPDGGWLATGSNDMTARLWDVASGETIQVYRGHNSNVFGVTFCGTTVATHGFEGIIRLWDAADPVLYAAHAVESMRTKGLPLLGHSEDTDSLVLVHHGTQVADAVFSPDGRRIATSAPNDNDAPFQVIVRDLVTRQESGRIATPPAAERDLAFSTDGKLLGVLLHAKVGQKSATELRVYDSSTGQIMWQATGPDARGTLLGIHPASGRFEAHYLCSETESTLVRYDPASGREEQRISCERAIDQPLYLENGRRLLGVTTRPVDGSHQVVELDPNTGRVLRTFSTGRVNLTATAASGRWLATAFTTGAPAVIIVWDVETGQIVHMLEGAIGRVTSLVFSPDGKRLLSAGSDLAARIWDLVSGRELLTLSNHGGVVTRCIWSPDGGRIATAARDGVVRVWSAEGSGMLPAVEKWAVISPQVPANTTGYLKVERGEWRVENGDIIGTLRENPRDLPGPSFANARTTLTKVDLPRTVDIQTQVTLSKPMILAIGLADPASSLGYSSLVSGVLKPAGLGAWLLVTNKKDFQLSSLQGVIRPFSLEANRPYNVRVLRQGGRIRLFVDGHELVDEKIPDIDLPELFIQGSWSAVGDEIRFSRLTVRAPAEAVQARKLQARLDRLFAEELLPEPVKARLAGDKDLTVADRQTLLSALSSKRVDISALRDSARSLSTKDTATPAELERARRQVSAALDLAGGRTDQPTEGTVGDLGILALVEYRLGHAEEAAAALFPTLDFVRSRQGYNTLGELGLAGLVEKARGRTDSARRYLQRMRDADRPEAKWDKAAQPQLAEAKQLADRLLTHDADREAVKEAYLGIEDAGWHRKDSNLYFGGRTPDCRDIDQRDTKPGPHDYSLSLSAQRARRSMQFQEVNVDAARFLHDDWDIRISGDTAEMSLASIVVIPHQWTGRWAGTVRLKRVGGEWKIEETRSRQTHQTENDVLTALDDVYWAKKDKAVAEAKDDSEKLDKLVDARRYRDAFELGRKFVAGGKVTADNWVNYAYAALNQGETAEAVRAAKKANELDPDRIALPPWAK